MTSLCILDFKTTIFRRIGEVSSIKTTVAVTRSQELLTLKDSQSTTCCGFLFL